MGLYASIGVLGKKLYPKFHETFLKKRREIQVATEEERDRLAELEWDSFLASLNLKVTREPEGTYAATKEDVSFVADPPNCNKRWIIVPDNVAMKMLVLDFLP